MAYAPPIVYSHVTGITSPTGAEAEGWLITVGGTPKEIMAHRPGVHLRQAARGRRGGPRARRPGHGPRRLHQGRRGRRGDGGASKASLPITTGNSYSASGRPVGRPRGGATGSACSSASDGGIIRGTHHGRRRHRGDRLGLRPAARPGQRRAVAGLPRDGQAAGPQAGHRARAPRAPWCTSPRRPASTWPTWTSSSPPPRVPASGCSTSWTSSPAASSPTSPARSTCRPRTSPSARTSSSSSPARSSCPGDVRMRDIGLPPGVAYACLAETVALALEGRYETFTVGPRHRVGEGQGDLPARPQARHAAGRDLRGQRRLHRRGLRPGAPAGPGGPQRVGRPGRRSPRPA